MHWAFASTCILKITILSFVNILKPSKNVYAVSDYVSQI